MASHNKTESVEVIAHAALEKAAQMIMDEYGLAVLSASFTWHAGARQVNGKNAGLCRTSTIETSR